MINVIDLFCGVGGLSHGMKRQGLNIVAGIDNDKSCAYYWQCRAAVDRRSDRKEY